MQNSDLYKAAAIRKIEAFKIRKFELELELKAVKNFSQNTNMKVRAKVLDEMIKGFDQELSNLEYFL